MPQEAFRLTDDLAAHLARIACVRPALSFLSRPDFERHSQLAFLGAAQRRRRTVAHG